MTDSLCTWTVLQFFDDASVEAIPSTWIQGDQCHWPAASREKLLKMIKNCDCLNTCWPPHPAKIFRNATNDSYLKAREKARLAEETSELNTEAEETIMKRKKVQKIISNSRSSDEESILLAPPKIKEFKKKRDKMLKNIFQQGHAIRSMLATVLSEVRSLKMSNHVPTEVANTFLVNPDLPAANDDQSNRIENLLENEQDFNRATVELSRLGGANTYGFVKRCLILIMENDQAIKYSWLERKEKRRLSRTNVAKLILKLAEIVQDLPRNQKQVEILMQTWLRRASDRRQPKANKKF